MFSGKLIFPGAMSMQGLALIFQTIVFALLFASLFIGYCYS